MPPALTPRHLEALRACKANPGGMRILAHRTAMQALEGMGYVEARAPKGRPNEVRWFLTQSGRDVLKALGTRKVVE